MRSTVAIIAVTDSFSGIWQTLVESAGATCLVVETAAELRENVAPCAAVVVGVGDDAGSLRAVSELARGGLRNVVAVGVDCDWQDVRPLLKAGASDFFELPGAVAELREWLVGRIAESLPGTVSKRGPAPPFDRLLGDCRAFRDVLLAAETFSASGAATILLNGETGTGKDLLAQAIHERSLHRGGRFVELNCAALPAHLLEAELFGYERGAFTDARDAKMGLIEAADGGTLFLDEVGDMPLELQSKILRVLETKRVRKLGSVKEIAVRVRLIAATHVDLPQRVRERRFREDLYYRLDVLSLTLPPLRARIGDAVLLAERFSQDFSRAYGFPYKALSPEVRSAIAACPWPGNVRQLRNAVERAVILGTGMVTLSGLRLDSGRLREPDAVLPFPATLEHIQSAAGRAAVAACEGNKSRAADLLGITRKRLYALLRGSPPIPAS